MGTRGALGVKLANKYYVTYNHWDSYPSGLGQQVVEFIRYTIIKKEGSQLIPFKRKILKLQLVKSDDVPTVEQIDKYMKYADLSVSEQTLKDWYCLLRSIQGIKTLERIRDGKLEHLIDGYEFLKDSLFCEYAYIINLDTDELEFYRGFQRKPQKGNPFGEENAYEGEKGNPYYPVILVGKCPLNKIPRNWEEKFYPQDKEDN